MGRKYGEFRDFDESTASRAKLDVARIKISTNFIGLINDPVVIKALGVIYTIQIQAHGGSVLGVSDVDGSGDGKSQPQLLLSADKGVDGKGNEIQIVKRVGSPTLSKENVDGTNSLLLTKGDMMGVVVTGLAEKGDSCMMGTCQIGGVEAEIGGPVEKQFCCDNQGVLLVGDPVRVRPHNRSNSLPPSRVGGSNTVLGSSKDVGLDFSDTISLIEDRRGVVNYSAMEQHSQLQEIVSKQQIQRGRPKKREGRSRRKNSNLPKFIQIAEAVKEGGAKQRRKKKGNGLPEKRNSNIGSVGPIVQVMDTVQSLGTEQITVVPESSAGLNLEVVLTGFEPTPSSGVALLLASGQVDENLPGTRIISESVKLLDIHKQVGFYYEVSDGEVVKVLPSEEARDRLKKEEWERRNVDQ
jgi:hypothetical protein